MININEDIELVKQCYYRFKKNQEYYKENDRYYFGNTDVNGGTVNLPDRSKQIVDCNFIQKLDDEEALYSFGNKITYKAKDEKHKKAIDEINRAFSNNGASYRMNCGKRLVQFHLGYEYNFIDSKGNFKSKYITPLQGDIYTDEFDEPLFFIYVHTIRKIKNGVEKLEDLIDVIDDTNIYRLNNNFGLISVTTHKMGTIPVGVGIVDNVRYTEENGYIEGDKTNYRTCKTIQDAYQRNFSDIVQEITDYHNAILKIYGIDLKNKLDENGEVILDKWGEPIKEQPVISENSILYFQDKNVQDAEWLIKNINDTFIKNTRDDLKDLIYTLTSHIDNNEKMQSNLSGIALRSKLQCLEAKVSSNEAAMEDIIRKRIECLFNYLRSINKGDYDPKMIDITFTPKVPQDLTVIVDAISKLDHDIVSNKTKRSWLPQVSNPELEEELIKQEDKDKEPDIDLDKLNFSNDNTDNTNNIDNEENKGNVENE